LAIGGTKRERGHEKSRGEKHQRKKQEEKRRGGKVGREEGGAKRGKGLNPTQLEDGPQGSSPGRRV